MRLERSGPGRHGEVLIISSALLLSPLSVVSWLAVFLDCVAGSVVGSGPAFGEPLRWPGCVLEADPPSATRDGEIRAL